jgi:hypothetical protein
LTARTRSSTHRPGRRPALLHAGSNSTPKLGMEGRRAGNRDVQLLPPAYIAAVMAWSRGLQARVEQLCHRTNVGWSGASPMAPRGSACQPSPPRASRAVPLFIVPLACHSRSSSAASGPVPCSRYSGRRGCRTAARERGTPGSASRRSEGCTDGRRRAWASTCSGGPCPTPSRARWRSPPVGASSGRSRGLTALAWLPGSDQPTKQAGTAKPQPHRGATVLCRRSALPGTVWVRRGAEGATASAPSPWRSRSPGAELSSKGRASEADETGRRWFAQGRSRCRAAPKRGPVRRLGATSMTSNGNQVRVLDPVDGRPSGFRRR